MRDIKETDLVGKTIKSIDSRAVNALILTFTDDTTLQLTAEQAITTGYGSIPGIFVEE